MVIVGGFQSQIFIVLRCMSHGGWEDFEACASVNYSFDRGNKRSRVVSAIREKLTLHIALSSSFPEYDPAV